MTSPEILIVLKVIRETQKETGNDGDRKKSRIMDPKVLLVLIPLYLPRMCVSLDDDT